MIGIVRVVYEVERELGEHVDYDLPEGLSEEATLVEMAKFDEENCPEFWEENTPTSFEFVMWKE